MDWYRLTVDVLDSPVMARASAAQVGTWALLLLYSSRIESRGVLRDVRSLEPAAWARLCGADGEVVRDDSPLWRWEGDDLVIELYDTWSADRVHQARKAGRRGGRPKSTGNRSVTERVPSGNRSVTGRKPCEDQAVPERSPVGDRPANRVRDRDRERDRERTISESARDTGDQTTVAAGKPRVRSWVELDCPESREEVDRLLADRDPEWTALASLWAWYASRVGLSVPTRLDPQSRAGKTKMRKLRQAVTERPLTEWDEIIRRILGRPDCRGREDGWSASLDYLLEIDRPDQHLPGGKYGSRPLLGPNGEIPPEQGRKGAVDMTVGASPSQYAGTGELDSYARACMDSIAAAASSMPEGLKRRMRETYKDLQSAMGASSAIQEQLLGAAWRDMMDALREHHGRSSSASWDQMASIYGLADPCPPTVVKDRKSWKGYG
jgi:hypothetical protein